MNYMVGERSEPKKFKYYKSYTKKHILYEKIWIYCITINMWVIVYQKYYIVSGLYYCIILYIFLPLIVLIVSFGHAAVMIKSKFLTWHCYEEIIVTNLALLWSNALSKKSRTSVRSGKSPPSVSSLLILRSIEQPNSESW